MKQATWLQATVGGFVVLAASDFIIHQVWLGDFYRAHVGWWRPEAEMQPLMPFLFASNVVLAGLLAGIYSKGYEAGKGGVGQGFRFGVLMGLALYLPKVLMSYVVYPYPVSLLANWFMGGILEVTLAGMVIGALYKPKKA